MVCETSLYCATTGRRIMSFSCSLATGTTSGNAWTTSLSSYELFHMGRDSLAYWFCTFWLVMNCMYFQAASWFWLPFAMAMPMLPLTPGAPTGPFGVWAMSICPATWLSLGSLANENMYVQLRAIAA